MAVQSILLTGIATGFGAIVVLTMRDLFLNGYKNDFENRYQTSDPTNASPKRRRPLSAVTKAIKVVRWFSCPLTAAAAAWALAVDTDNILAHVPSILSYYGASIHKVLPLHPRHLQDAFDLGEAHRAYLGGAVEEAMAIATRIAGRAVSADELEKLPSIIRDLMNETGVVSRVLSVFTITNIAWFIAILGLTATVVPFVVVITKPLWKGIMEMFTALFRLLVRLAKWLQPVYEPLLYSLSLLVLTEATRYSKSNDPYGMTGTMVAVTSIAMFALSWGLTTSRNSSGGGNFQTYMQITWALGALYCIPIAKIHQSSLIGYIAVGALAAAMKFSAFSSGLCLVIGFNSRQELVTACIGCGSMTVLFAIAKGLGVQSDWIKPLESAASVIGSSVYLLGLDILCYVDRKTRSHVFYVANLAAFIVAGEMLNLRGMSNVGKTYTGLFLFTLYCEAAPYGSKDGFIVWLFALFAALYGGSLYLNQHPEYVAALFTGGLLD